MNITAWLIGLVHGLFPFLGGMLKGKKGLVIGAVIGVVIAFLIGDIHFAWMDLVGVAVGCTAGYFFKKN